MTDDDFERRLERDLREWTDSTARPRDWTHDARALVSPAKAAEGGSQPRLLGLGVAGLLLASAASIFLLQLGPFAGQPIGNATGQPSGAFFSVSPTATLEPEPGTSGAADATKAEIDRLFATAEQCELSVADYIVTIAFPSAWSTNEAAGEGVPACLWFGPDLTQPTTDGPPEGVAIGLGFVDGPSVFQHAWISREDTTIAGRRGWRVEESVPSRGDPARETLQLVYWVSLGSGPTEGPTFVARTATEAAGNYDLNKAVLDRMMASLTIR